MQRRWLCLPFILLTFLAEAQKSKGLAFDDRQYSATKEPATLIRGDYTPLPASASIKQYCPKSLNQKFENTSAGWAAAYGARTILEAMRRGLTDPMDIRKVSFSPSFNYYLARPEGSSDCSVPVKLPDVLESMKKYGVPKYMEFQKLCPTNISDRVFVQAVENRISDYFRLFDLDEDPDDKIEKVKRAISKNSPVIIGMSTPLSFELTKDVFWVPRERDTPKEQPGHAMVVVGYDDTKYTGAFEVMNSWGTEWGKEGIMWIRYRDFKDYVRYGFEIFIMTGTNPDAIDLAGDVEIELVQGEVMEFDLVNESEGFFRTKEVYPDSTAFRIRVSSMESSFVYIIGSDDTETIYALFPEEGKSAALPYKNSHVVLPDERDFWYLDDVPGSGYLCVVFSKEELWLKELEVQFNELRGMPFGEKVKQVFKGKSISSSDIQFAHDRIHFEGKSRDKVLMTTVIEIQHN